MSDGAGDQTNLGTTLVDARRAAARERVLDVARRLVGTTGLDVTMDEIAAAADISRRTLFRYFETREALIAAAVRGGMVRYGEQLPALPEHGDWEAWLAATCDATHRMNASYGPGFWELTSRADLPPELAAAETKRRAARRRAMTRIATTLWHAVGGKGDVPRELVEVVGAHLSPHFTAALVTDVGTTWQRASELSRAAIVSTLEAALQT